MERAERGDLAPEAAVVVEQRGLDLGPQQPLMLALRDHLDRVAHELRQERRRRQPAVDLHAPASLAGQRALHQQLVVPRIRQPQRRRALEQRRSLEHRLDGRLGGAGAHQLRRAALSAQERERAEQHRLARAGLPGDRVQARAELELERLDHGEVGQAQPTDHGAPQRSFSRSVSK